MSTRILSQKGTGSEGGWKQHGVHGERGWGAREINQMPRVPGTGRHSPEIL